MATVAIVEQRRLAREAFATLISHHARWAVEWVGDDFRALLQLRAVPEISVVGPTAIQGLDGYGPLGGLILAGSRPVVMIDDSDWQQCSDLQAVGVNVIVSTHASGVELLQAMRAAHRHEGWMSESLRLAQSSTRSDRTPPEVSESNGQVVLADLSQRERDVIVAFAQGAKVASIARGLGVSEHTARHHLRNAKEKLRTVGRPADTRVDWYVYCQEAGLIE